MLQTIESYLSEAAEALGNRDNALPERVMAAAEKLWSAMYREADWPPELLKRAYQVMETVLVNGPVKLSVPKMDEATLERLAQSIMSLAVQVQAALSKSRNVG